MAKKPAYRCHDCSVSGVKLWRGYQEMSPFLQCLHCTAKRWGKEVPRLDASGRIYHPDLDCWTYDFSWSVPAVPVPDQPGAYYGFGDMPEEAVWWWNALPNYIDDERYNRPPPKPRELELHSLMQLLEEPGV